MCNGQHAIWGCDEFRGMSFNDKWIKATELAVSAVYKIIILESSVEVPECVVLRVVEKLTIDFYMKRNQLR